MLCFVFVFQSWFNILLFYLEGKWSCKRAETFVERQIDKYKKFFFLSFVFELIFSQLLNVGSRTSSSSHRLVLELFIVSAHTYQQSIFVFFHTFQGIRSHPHRHRRNRSLRQVRNRNRRRRCPRRHPERKSSRLPIWTPITKNDHIQQQPHQPGSQQ